MNTLVNAYMELERELLVHRTICALEGDEEGLEPGETRIEERMEEVWERMDADEHHLLRQVRAARSSVWPPPFIAPPHDAPIVDSPSPLLTGGPVRRHKGASACT